MTVQRAKTRRGFLGARLALITYLSIGILFPAFNCKAVGGEQRLSNWLFHEIEDFGIELLLNEHESDHSGHAHHDHSNGDNPASDESNHSHDYFALDFVGVTEKNQNGFADHYIQVNFGTLASAAEFSSQLSFDRTLRPPSPLTLKSQVQMRRSVVLIV